MCGLILKPVTGAGELQFASGQVMLVLVATITVPRLLGVGINHVAPRLAHRSLRVVEVMSEAAGACSLAFVTIVDFHSIVGMSWKAVLVMVVIFERCFAAGYRLAQGTASRRVVALGTSNRNIALALLVALQSFPDLHVVSAVVGNGLLLILLGLAHVGYWNLREWQRRGRTP